MQSEKNEDSLEKLVIPLFEIVAYPGSRTKFPVDLATGDLLLAAKNDADAAEAVGLTVKSGTRPSELTGESLYKTGTCSGLRMCRPPITGTWSVRRL